MAYHWWPSLGCRVQHKDSSRGNTHAHTPDKVHVPTPPLPLCTTSSHSPTQVVKHMAEAKARKLEEARQAVAEAKLRAEQKEAAAQVRTQQQPEQQQRLDTSQRHATRIHTHAHRRSWLHDAPQWRKRGHIGAKSSLNVSNAMGRGEIPCPDGPHTQLLLSLPVGAPNYTYQKRSHQ